MDTADIELTREKTSPSRVNKKVIDNQIDLFLPVEDCLVQHENKTPPFSRTKAFNNWVKRKFKRLDSVKDTLPPRWAWLHPEQIALHEQNSEDFSGNIWKPSKLTIRDDISRSAFHSVALFVPNDSVMSTLRNQQASKNTIKSGLKLILSQRAKDRLKKAGCDYPTIPIEITGVYYYRFKTGPSIFRLSCSVASLKDDEVHPSQVVEAVYALSHNTGSLSWTLSNDTGGYSSKEFTLAQFIEDLLGHKPINIKKHARLYTSTFINVNDFEKHESIELVSQLAGHRTDDYLLNTDLCRHTIAFPFDNIMRCTEFEGNAFLIRGNSDRPSPPFLQNFRLDNYENAYFPLQLLRYQQFCTLSHLQNRLIDATSSKEPVDFIQLIEASLQSRLEKNIPVISKVNMHNQYYQSLGQALHIEEMMNKLIGDTQEISQLLRVRLEESSEKSLLWLHILGSGVMAFLTTYTVLKEVLSSFGLLNHKSGDANLTDMHCILNTHSMSIPCLSMDILPVFSGLIVGCSLIAILAFIKHRSKKICHLGEHLYKDQVVIHGAIH